MHSTTGRSPVVAAPIAAPTKADSVMGVSMTRSPNFSTALGNPQNSAPGVHLTVGSASPRHVLTHDDYGFVPFHFLRQASLIACL